MQRSPRANGGPRQFRRETDDTRGDQTGTGPLAEAACQPPGGQRHSPSGYLTLIERAAASAGVPVIASLNGSTTGDWTDYAAAMQRAGAAASAAEPDRAGYLDALEKATRTYHPGP